MHSLILALTLAGLASADFFIANTTSCYGEFFVGKCYDNVQVITDGVDYNETFTCDKLYQAQDSSYVKTNTAGPNAESFTSTGDICDAGRLHFERNYTSSSVNGTFDIYKGSEATGDSIGQCEYYEAVIDQTKLRCSQLMGTIFYVTAYRCNTTEEICGSKSSTTTSSSSSTTTSTAAATSSSATSSASSATTTTAGSTTATDSSATTASSSATSESSSTTAATATGTSESTSATSAESSTADNAKRTAFAKRWYG